MIEKNIVFSFENMEKKSRTMNFSPKSYALIWDFQNISKIKSFYPNLRLRVCLAMCLIFQQSEPSTLINRVLIKKRMCKLRASDARILKQNKNIVSFPLMVSCIRPTQNKANGFSPPQQSQKQKQQPFR